MESIMDNTDNAETKGAIVELPHDDLNTDYRSDSMDVDEGTTESQCKFEMEDADTRDVLDQTKLIGLLNESNKAGKHLSGKKVLLLVGGTGAGKVSANKKKQRLHCPRCYFD